ncbi:MAG: dihydrofolate reductase family protein [Patescibacteria group bacterium]|nr:dihydrofolate reductase family protein [Patescibacteria group bacterium]
MYSNLVFPAQNNRPFFFINAVQTVDGKTQVTHNRDSYWPIGSEYDYKTMLKLRLYADVLIHGKNTAICQHTLDNLGKEDFQQKRKKHGKTRKILYLIVSANPTEELLDFLINPSEGTDPLLVTTSKTHLSSKLSNAVKIIRMGNDKVDMLLLAKYLHSKNYRNVLVEGGSILWSSFFACNLVDEIFITVAPKIFGDKTNETLSLISDCLFPPDKIRRLKLLSAKKHRDEVYLHYRVITER